MAKKRDRKVDPAMNAPASAPAPAKPAAPTTPQTDVHELKVLALIHSEAARAEILYALKPLADVAVQLIGRKSEKFDLHMPDGSTPTVLLLDADVSNPEDLDQVRELKRAAPIGVSVIALTDRATDLAALRAIRAGADDVLLRPINADEAREVFGRVRHVKLDDQGRGAGARTLVFMHVMGGAGASTLAVNAAAALATTVTNLRTGLLDLDIQFGACASLLDLPTTSPVENLFEEPARLDREMLENMMLRHACGLRVLTAPRAPLPLDSLDTRVVGEVLKLAKRAFHYVIVDMPVALTPWTETVLRAASTVYIVTELSVPAAHRLSRLFDLFREEDLTQIPVKIVVNKHDASLLGGELTIAQFGKAIGRQVDHVLPDEAKLIASSHNHGRPAWQFDRTSPFCARLEEMLNKDLEAEVFAATPSRRWLKFGRA